MAATFFKQGQQKEGYGTYDVLLFAGTGKQRISGGFPSGGDAV